MFITIFGTLALKPLKMPPSYQNLHVFFSILGNNLNLGLWSPLLAVHACMHGLWDHFPSLFWAIHEHTLGVYDRVGFLTHILAFNTSHEHFRNLSPLNDRWLSFPWSWANFSSPLPSLRALVGLPLLYAIVGPF